MKQKHIALLQYCNITFALQIGHHVKVMILFNIACQNGCYVYHNRIKQYVVVSDYIIVYIFAPMFTDHSTYSSLGRALLFAYFTQELSL